jgi:hypothetical protein
MTAETLRDLRIYCATCSHLEIENKIANNHRNSEEGAICEGHQQTSG